MVRHEAPIRSQYQRLISFSVIYRNLQASKTTFFLKKSLHLFFAAALRPARGLSSFSPSTPLQQHGGPKNDTVFQKIFLLYNRSLHPSKNDIGFVNPLKKLPISITTTLPPPQMDISFDFLLSRSAEADPGGANVVLPLLLYRNIQSKKVNTASKLFPLLLNSHMRGLENDIKLQFFSKTPSTLLPQPRRPKNDIDF